VALLALVLISFSFLPAGAAGRDDANDLVLAIVFDGVGDQQQEHASHQAQSLPAALATFNALLLREGAGVVKDILGDFYE